MDCAGRLVGINTFIFTSSGSSAGVGFAIPINRAMRVVNEIKKFGHVRQLGADFQVMDITRRLQNYLQLKSNNGVFVRSVDRNGAGQKAGLEPGDVIQKIDDQMVMSVDQFWTLFAVHYVGDVAKFSVWRKGKTFDLSYPVTESKPQQRGQ